MLGSTFVPIILGSDKTTVSIATGNNEFYLLYLSIGNVHNNVRRAHRHALVLLGFLAIPKSKCILFYCICDSELIQHPSNERTFIKHGFSKVPVAAIPSLPLHDPQSTQGCNDIT